MKNIAKNALFIIAAFSILTIVSCGEDNEDIKVAPVEKDKLDARLNNTDSLTATVFTKDITDGEINIRLSLKASDKDKIRRVYASKNEFGQGVVAVDGKELGASDTKGDKSIDIATKDNEGVVYFVTLKLSSFPKAEGTIVYNFWATKNKGDHRKPEQDLVNKVATLTINLGGSNKETELASSEDVKLYAPTKDLTSKSFVSSLDGKIYGLDDFENSDLWDMGYSAQNNEPQLTSAFGSPQKFPGETKGTTITFQELIKDKTGATAESLNKVYFADIDDDFDFDGAKNNSDFKDLKVSTSDKQFIDIPTDAKGDLIAFIDQYGKKGIIRIDLLFDDQDDQQYYNAKDYVQIDIKVQK